MDDRGRLACIRLISERYHELQGLRGALIGTAFTVVMGTYLTVSGWNDARLSTPIAIGLTFAIIIPGMLWLDRYYERTFGRVKPGRAAGRLSFVIPAAFTLAVIVERGLLGPSHAGIFLVLGGFPLWTAIRDWPLRRYHFLGAAAGFVAAGVQFTDAAQQSPDVALAGGFFIIGAATMLTGFADHRLLARSIALHPVDEPSCTTPARR